VMPAASCSTLGAPLRSCEAFPGTPRWVEPVSLAHFGLWQTNDRCARLRPLRKPDSIAGFPQCR
jgi:hypothetical protein